MGGSRHRRRERIRRPAALLCAAVTLLAGLFLCLSAGDPHRGGDPGTGAAAGTGTPHAASSTTARASAEYTCPFDRSDCGTFSHLAPAVLTVPPPAAPVTVADVQYGGLLRDAAAVRATGAQARAPDLHVLQVLRT
ncbi:hypothetical protein [Streptomyces sp. SYSU K21746]